jgi:hypothetical protein
MVEASSHVEFDGDMKMTLIEAAQRTSSAAAEMERLDKRECIEPIPARKMALIQRSAAAGVSRRGDNDG